MDMGKTNIICTLGPASSSASVISKLAHAGMTVARFNFSYGSHAEHLARLRVIQRINRNSKQPIHVLQDLEGYRLRIGRLRQSGGLPLVKGQVLRFAGRGASGKEGVLPLDYEGSLAGVHSGADFFIDDGKIMLRVLSNRKGVLRTKVLIPGLLRERKGVNIHGFQFPREGMTRKDEQDLDFGIRHRVQFIAQSFVRDKEDMLKLKERTHSIRPHIRIIAKIENSEGIKNIDEILRVTDGVMIARGDMGVSIPIYQIAVIQKWIIRKCNRRNKFVITATQMLDSMTEHPRPTRAEVTDVANAFLDGSDYLMLSGETAVGKYPVETVEMMGRIIQFTRRSLGSRRRLEKNDA